MTEYKHYYGICEPCEIAVHIETIGSAAIPEPGETWDSIGLRCPICGDLPPGGHDGADDETTESLRINRLREMRRADKATASLVALRLDLDELMRQFIADHEPDLAGVVAAILAKHAGSNQ